MKKPPLGVGRRSGRFLGYTVFLETGSGNRREAEYRTDAGDALVTISKKR
jgi:hypothetical protein